jgi:hypothetical protein
MLYQDALALVSANMCLQVQLIVPTAMKKAKVVAGPVEDTDHATWLAKDSWRFTLIKTAHGTFVYCHSHDYLYYAHPNVMLGPECPAGHAFLVQVLEDTKDGVVVPRVLVMDLVCPAVQNAEKRGEIMRGLAHVFPPLCHLQWAGNKAALQKFIDKGLPHQVDSIVALKSVPLHIVRECSLAGGGPSVLEILDDLPAVITSKKRKASVLEAH